MQNLMNKNIIKSIAAIFPILSLMACSENEWNDKYLDGFKGGPAYSSTQTGNYTLTSDDYATISGLMLDLATSPEEEAAAKAIKTNQYFDATSPFPANLALPYFIASPSSPFFNFANGSSANVTFNEISGQPEELTAITTAYTYSVSTETSIEDIPEMLANKYPKAEEGQYAVVSYLPAIATKASTRSEESNTEEVSVMTVSEALQQMAAGFTGEANVIGVISKIDDLSTQYGNATYYIQDTLESEESLQVFRGYYLNGDKFTEDNQIVVGATVVVSGSLTIYNGTYEFNSGSSILYYYGDPVWSVAQALSELANGFEGEAVVRGIVSQIDDISTSYGNGTYWIKDNLEDENALEIYRGYFINGDKFTAEDQIAVGGSIIVSGKLTVYNGTSEFNSGSKVLNYFPGANMVDPNSLVNALFYFNGEEWTLAQGATVLDPDAYVQMGFANNDLSDPETYIPLYLKKALPYALEGDEMYVAYNLKNNSCSCGLYIFDGNSWTQNNDGLETLTALFAKSQDKWTFKKYIGKAIFNLFNDSEIKLNATYLLVSGSAAATPVPTENSYGYLQKTEVSVSNGAIEMPNDDNGFTFVDSYKDDNMGQLPLKTPEGNFLIRDSNGRYLYLQGTFTSFNVSESPLVDGVISNDYLFTAKNNGDGTWTIENNNGKKIFFSSGYSNFAAYESKSEKDYFPSLYLLAE